MLVGNMNEHYHIIFALLSLAAEADNAFADDDESLSTMCCMMLSTHPHHVLKMYFN